MRAALVTIALATTVAGAVGAWAATGDLLWVDRSPHLEVTP